MLGLVLLLAGSPGPSAPLTDLRFTVLMAEELAGSHVGSGLVESLASRGLTMVNAEQSAALRRLTDPKQPVDPSLLTAQEADLLLLGRAEGRVFQPMKVALHACQMQGNVRLIAVDTGEVLFATSVQVLERDMTPEGAVFHASKKLSRQLAEAVVGHLEGVRGRRFEVALSTAHRMDVRTVEESRRTLSSLSGVESTRVLDTSPRRIELEVRTRGIETSDLALSMAKAGGFFVWGYSNRVIRAELRERDLAPLSLGLQRFKPLGGSREADRWRATALPRTLAIAFMDHHVVRVEDEALLAAKPVTRVALSAAGLVPQRTLILGGTYRRDGNTVMVNASIRKAGARSALVGAAKACPLAAFTDCVAKIGHQLAAQLGPAVQRQLSPTSLRTTEAAPKPLQLEAVTPSDFFLASVISDVRGDTSPKLTLKNDGGEPIKDLVATVSLEDFVDAPYETKPTSAAPGATIDLALELPFNRTRLETHDSNRPAVLHISVSYRVGDFRIEDTFRHPVVVYHRNSIDWRDPLSIGAFADPSSDVVQAVAKQAVHRSPRDADGPLAASVAIFGTLAGLRYVRDPLNPFAATHVDFLQFPDETLRRGAGDCDDLAVLYATLHEAIGIPALIVMLPGHVFVAVPTLLPARIAPSTAEIEALRMIPHDGRWWVPVETTRTQGTFSAAWDVAADKYIAAKRAQSASVISIRDAWRAHRPSSLAPSGPSPRDLRFGTGVAEMVAEVSRELRTKLQTSIESVDKELVARPGSSELLNRRGVLLIALGRVDEASRAFALSRDANTNSEGPLNNLANLALMAGDPSGAIKKYSRALAKADQGSLRHRHIVLNRLLAAYSVDPGGSPFVDLVMDATDADLKAFYELIRNPLPADSGEPERLPALVYWL